jgi:hypothetical protein
MYILCWLIKYGTKKDVRAKIETNIPQLDISDFPSGLKDSISIAIRNPGLEIERLEAHVISKDT